MFPVKPKQYCAYQPEKEYDQGINIKNNLYGFDNYKGLDGFNYVLENYSIHYKKKTNIAYKLIENEELILNKKPLEVNSDTSSLNILIDNREPTDNDIKFSLYKLNKQIVTFKQCKSKGYKKYSLIENQIPLSANVVSDKQLIQASTTDIEIDIREFDTNKTERATEYDLIKLLNEEVLQRHIFDCNYQAVKELIERFEDEEHLVTKLINTEDLRGINPLFLIIYLRECHKDDIDKKSALRDILLLLLNNKLHIRIRNEEKRTPLEEAIAYVSQYININIIGR
jgi:hypothetical protein